MNRTRIAQLIACLLLVGATFYASVNFLAPSLPNYPHPTPRIEEDDPRWDCSTMGNHICGTTTTTIQSARRFAIDAAQATAGDDFFCTAEDNLDMPEGFEVICYPNGN